MRYLITLFILSTSISFAQTEASSIESLPVSIGIYGSHFFGKTSDQHYQTSYATTGTEETDNSFSQLYSISAGYDFKKGFLRFSTGVLVDFIDLEVTENSGYYNDNGTYSTSYSSSSTTVVKDRNSSLYLGAQIGTFFTKGNSWFNIGGAFGFDFISRYSNTVIENEISGTWTSSSNGPDGPSSSSGTISYDNQSNYWANRITKINSSFLSPNLHLIMSFRISDQLFVELQGSARFSYQLLKGNEEEPESQFPVSIGVRYHIF